MSSKPHASEPVVVSEQDSFGNTVFRLTDPWARYFDDLNSEVNINVTNTSNSYTTSTNNSIVFSDVDKIKKELVQLRSVIAQLMSVKHVDHTKQLQAIQAMIAQLLAQKPAENKTTNVSMNFENPKTKQDNTWLSTLGNLQI